MAGHDLQNALKAGLFRLKVVGLAVGLSLVSGIATSQAVYSDTPLRVMAANTTSGNRQSYDPGEGTRIFQGLQPDIVLIQEFNFGDNSEGAIAAWVESTFGPEFTYYREDDAQIPNGVVSRYPIIAAGEWNDSQVGNRDFAWAQIDIPGERDLWAVSVHFLTRSASVRASQANAVRRLVEDNIPEGDYLTIGGDFNTRNSGESALRALDGLVETDGPYPTDQDGVIGTNASRRRPYDWVFVDDDLEPLEVPVEIGANSFPNGLVFDSRVYSPLADVAPVMRGDSGATNMQHMAVIRDFVILDDGEEVAREEIFPIDEPTVETPTERTLLGQAEILESCQVVDGFADADAFDQYMVVVPEGASQLEIVLEGLAAEESDLDLYVRRGGVPSLTEYDFRPWLNDSNERVVVNASFVPSLSAGPWFIGIDGYIPGEYRLSAAIDKCGD